MQTEQLLSHQNLIFSNAISKAIIVISTSQISKSNGQFPHATDNAICKCMQNLQYHVLSMNAHLCQLTLFLAVAYGGAAGAGGGVRVEPHPHWTWMRTGS